MPHLSPSKTFLNEIAVIIASYNVYLGCRYGNRSDTCVSVGFSRATSERPHHEVKSDTPR